MQRRTRNFGSSIRELECEAAGEGVFGEFAAEFLGYGLSDEFGVSRTWRRTPRRALWATRSLRPTRSSDTLTYSVAATSHADGVARLEAFNQNFELDTASGQISVKSEAMLDFETPTSYEVLYQVTDSKNGAGEADPAIDDTLTLTITVTNADDPGTVTFFVNPVVGTQIVASIADVDGIPTGPWSYTWEKSLSRDSDFMVIPNETQVRYIPVDGDHGYYLRANITYTDAIFGPNKQASAVTENRVNELTLVSNWGQTPAVPLQTFLESEILDPGYLAGRWCLAQSFTAGGGTGRFYLLSQVEFGSEIAVHRTLGEALHGVMVLDIRLDVNGKPNDISSPDITHADLGQQDPGVSSAVLGQFEVPDGTAVASGSTYWFTGCSLRVNVSDTYGF